MIILGIARSKGEYEGNSYDNINFHCQDDTKEILAGTFTEVVKVKSTVLKHQFGDGYDVTELLGQDVLFSYDRYGKVQSIAIM